MSLEGWTVELPEEWRTAPWRRGFMRVIAEANLADGTAALLVTGMLKDGTTVFALSWQRGQRVARLSPDTGWALEERFTGHDPAAADERTIANLWRVAVDAMATSRKEAEADRAAGFPSMPASALVLASDDAMAEAYARYRERADGEPVSREDFEVAVEYLAANDLLEGGAP
jgi:hypothetical protein